MKELLSKLNYSILGFVAFSIRLAVFGASVGDAIALFAFAGLYGWQSYLKQLAVTKHNEKFEQDVQTEFKKAAQEISDLRTTVGSIKLSSTMGAAFNKGPHEQRR